MANLIAEKLVRSGKKGDKQTIRDTYSIYDRTQKPKLVRKGLTQSEVEQAAKDYLQHHPNSFLVVVRETTLMEVVKVT